MRDLILRPIIIMMMLLTVLPLHAQDQRDYALSQPLYEFNDDRSAFAVRFRLINNGADAVEDAVVRIYRVIDEDNSVLIDQFTLEPLAADESRALRFDLQSADYPAGNQQLFRIEAGVDTIEPAGSDRALNNALLISVPIPPRPGDSRTPPPETSTPSTPVDSGSPTDSTEAPLFQRNPDGSVIIAGRLFSSQDVRVGIAVGLLSLLLIWLLALIVRRILRRPPKMDAWQPPYGSVPSLDPGSVQGRRQAWQMVAQNGSILAQPVEGHLHAIKLLIGVGGQKLNNWQITGMRLSQYDSYGRIGRTATRADKRLLRQYNRVLRRRPKLSEDQLRRKLYPIARALVKQFRKKITQKAAFLPVAMDIRFAGQHGEVRIVFRLYQCQQGVWWLLDEWDPEMVLGGKDLQENYTYTIYGLMQGETLKSYRQRLVEDVHWLLIETIYAPVEQQQSVSPDAYDVPDTLSGMEPISDGQMPAM